MRETRHPIPHKGQLLRLSKLTAIRFGRIQQLHSAPRQPLQQFFERDSAFELREIRSETVVGADRKSQMSSETGSIDIEPIRIGKYLRISIG